MMQVTTRQRRQAEQEVRREVADLAGLGAAQLVMPPTQPDPAEAGLRAEVRRLRGLFASAQAATTEAEAAVVAGRRIDLSRRADWNAPLRDPRAADRRAERARAVADEVAADLLRAKGELAAHRRVRDDAARATDRAKAREREVARELRRKQARLAEFVPDARPSGIDFVRSVVRPLVARWQAEEGGE